MKLQLKNLTWADFDQHEPCYSPQEKYGDFSGTILDILKDERIPNADKIWMFTREGVMDDKTLRLFSVRCARQAQHLMKDERSINALDVAERYANGLATAEELGMAGAAAREAAWEAEGAAWEAWEAAWIASRASRKELSGALSASRKVAKGAQVQIAIDLINEFYEESIKE